MASVDGATLSAETNGRNTSTVLEQALALAARGFHVFPLIEGGKLPLITEWQNRATRDPLQIRAWWTCPITGFEQAYNIGICTTRYGDDKALLVVDVDNKSGKVGNQSVLELELKGHEFPSTYTQETPTGGRHFFYVTSAPVKQGVNVLGPGLDIRSRGGFVVASGSVVSSGPYTAGDSSDLSPAPGWLIDACGRAPDEKPETSGTPPAEVDQDRAFKRVTHYLLHEAPLAVKGQGGDSVTYKVAARCKDFGVDAKTAHLLMLEHWNPRTTPGWSPERLWDKVSHAYKYGSSAPGASAPEMQFKPVPRPPENPPMTPEAEIGHPFERINKNYAFVLAGGGHHILWETTDQHGQFRLEHLAEESFHKDHASFLMAAGDGVKPVTKLWMNSRDRRSYRGICFLPGGDAPEGWYNLWRGFAVEPTPRGDIAGTPADPGFEAQWAVEAWIEHLTKNVCGGNEQLARWLTAYFAQLVQEPGVKPLVALVLRGGKGVGKNALIQLGMHNILGAHARLYTDRRYLVGQFNGHFENLLLVTFDEAFWSGDKQAEGILKGLITGDKHVIEHKGKEPYAVENKCRVVIIGNEEWLVPASHDERRFAVFDVGPGRRNDRAFFERMRKGMAAGGASLLLRYLLDFDYTGIDINAAPSTQGLLDQKTATLDPFQQWWFDCLSEGWIVGSDFAGVWPAEIDKERMRYAFGRYLKDRNIRARMADERGVGKAMKKFAPSIASGKRRLGENAVNVYRLQPLPRHRAEWEQFIGHTVEWNP